MMDMAVPLLELKGVTKYFGGLPAAKEVTFSVYRDEIVALIGPNGAGKTTLMNCISGLHRLTEGRIIFNGKDITSKKIHERCQKMIGRTFQIPRPFGKMSVLENVMVGCHYGLEMAINCLELVDLEHKQDFLANSLTFHELRKLELSRALATDPMLLLLDEVMAGLTAEETEEMMSLVEKIRVERKVAVLWVEHVMRAVMESAQRIIVMNQGMKLIEGEPQVIAKNEEVIEVYLGEKYVFRGDEEC